VTADTAAIKEEVLAGTDASDPPIMVVPPGDAPALVDALRRLAADPIGRARMAVAARRLYDERFRPDVAVGPLLDALRTLAR
jgi:hypothetical protein